MHNAIPKKHCTTGNYNASGVDWRMFIFIIKPGLALHKYIYVLYQTFIYFHYIFEFILSNRIKVWGSRRNHPYSELVKCKYKKGKNQGCAGGCQNLALFFINWRQKRIDVFLDFHEIFFSLFSLLWTILQTQFWGLCKIRMLQQRAAFESKKYFVHCSYHSFSSQYTPMIWQKKCNFWGKVSL